MERGTRTNKTAAIKEEPWTLEPTGLDYSRMKQFEIDDTTEQAWRAGYLQGLAKAESRKREKSKPDKPFITVKISGEKLNLDNFKELDIVGFKVNGAYVCLKCAHKHWTRTDNGELIEKDDITNESE